MRSTNDDSIRKTTWRVVGIFAGILYVGLAYYFDWSDRYIHTFLASALVVFMVPLPRVCATSLVLLLLLFAIGHWAYHVPQWASEIHRGDSWEAVVGKLGEPTYHTGSLDESRELMVGYSSPSPVMFRHRGQVAVYLQGEHILWVGHDGNQVVDLFIGGS
jgi:hypothetical protein